MMNKKIIGFIFLILLLILGVRYFGGKEKSSENIQYVSGDYTGTREMLEDRKKAQFETLEQFQIFYDFQFENRIEESKITFVHKIVDDAGKQHKEVHYDHGNGIAVTDIDNDGFLDIYFITQIGSNELYRNLHDGTFKNITMSAGVGLEDRISVSASFADIDNDGDEDLYVTTVKMGNVLFENNGDGTFKDISKMAGVGYVGHSSSATFFDYNNDGLLDLFVTNVGKYTGNERGVGGYFIGDPNAFHSHLDVELAEQSLLFRNLGNKKFKNVSQETRLEDISWSGDASFTDFNSDGYPDLYVLNMQGDDHYYENQKGEYFIEKTQEYFPKTSWGAMGIKFFDFENDGFIDLYITDMHSDMFSELDIKDEKTKVNILDYVRESFVINSANNIFGNTFYRNIGGSAFTEVSQEIGAENYWPWGVSIDDLNADGYQDAFIASSMNFPLRYGVNSVLLNNNGEKFLDSEFILGIEPRRNGEFDKEWFLLDCSGADQARGECKGKEGMMSVRGSLGTRSSVIFDIENDGDLDIVTNEFNSEPQFFISNLSDKKEIYFLKIQLVGGFSNRNALGATVIVHTDSDTYTKYNDGKSGYLSQSQIPLYFGLGTSTAIDMIEVIWPTGEKSVIKEIIPVNTIYTIQERKR